MPMTGMFAHSWLLLSTTFTKTLMLSKRSTVAR